MEHRRHASRRRWPLLIILGVFLLVQAISGGLDAVAQDKPRATGANQLSTELEGQKFVGILKAQGDDDPDKDAFMFKDGKFVSEGCQKWGFSPAPYWVRRDQDGVHFLSELSSPEHGTMRYEGVFDGKEIKGTAYWKKVRWYWTSERQYIFQGKQPVPGQ